MHEIIVTILFNLAYLATYSMHIILIDVGAPSWKCRLRKAGTMICGGSSTENLELLRGSRIRARLDFARSHGF